MKFIVATVLIVTVSLVLCVPTLNAAQDLLKGDAQSKQAPGAGEAQDNAEWGEPVRGAKARLKLPTCLRFGQPLEGELAALPPSDKGPYVHVMWEKPTNAKVELTDAKGQSVPCSLQLLWQDAGQTGNISHFRIWPTETHAHGRYWKPGVYQVRIMIAIQREWMSPHHWFGRLASNNARIEIAEADAVPRSSLKAPAFRRRVVELIADLEADEFAKREAAEKALINFGVPVLPLVEQAVPKASRDAATRLERVRLGTLKTLQALQRDAVGPLLANLDDEAWDSLGRYVKESATFYGVQRARFAPLLTLPEKDVVERLGHDDPGTRIRAIRSLPRTKDVAVLQKLMRCLHDTYEELDSFIDPFTVHPVAREAEEAIVWQGQVAVPLILKLAADNSAQDKWLVTRLLGQIGPTDASVTFLTEILQGKDVMDRRDAVQALAAWGRASVPILLKVARDDSRKDGARSAALDHVARYGTKDEAKAVLTNLVAANPQALTWPIVEGIVRLKLREMVADLKRIALAEDIDDNTRCLALVALVDVAEKKDAEKVLLTLLTPQTHRAVRLSAMYRVADGGFRAAVPQLRRALKDDEVSASAGLALRALAQTAGRQRLRRG